MIPAATMVAAGVYVVARLFPLFLAAPAALTVLAVMASITMLLGALAAMAQADIKRVLAWSTVSQIGYMTGALAVGAPGAALFHLLTHAAFKALLFLAAGAVIHAVGSNLMADMGGLRKAMPLTFWSMTIGLAALVGLPPFAGFWSKDGVLAAAQHGQGPATYLVWIAAAITVALTGWYATRLWLRTFFGAARSKVPAHEPPLAMLLPVVLLAVPSALLGFAALVPGFAHRLGSESLFHLDPSALVPFALAAGGVMVAWRIWRAMPAADPARVLRRRETLANAFYLDAVQDALVTRPIQALAGLVRRADESAVDGVVESTGRGALGLGGALASVHRAALPRAATAALAGAVIFGAAAAAWLGLT
jgi:NADH-quinone oxidoreductase subunit L